MFKDYYKDIIIIPLWAPVALFKKREKIKEDLFSLPGNLVKESIILSKKAIHVIDNSALWFSEYVPDIIANFPLLNLITNPILEGFNKIPSKKGILLKFNGNKVSESCLSDLKFYDSNGDSLQFRWADSFIDNFNNIYDQGEEFIDELNGKWDEGEDFIDGNGKWDEGEEFVDGNDAWDEGEEFVDGNGIWDEGEEFVDELNGKWDEGEKFIDGNGIWDEGEEFIDMDGNGDWNGYCSEDSEESKNYDQWLNQYNGLLQRETELLLDTDKYCTYYVDLSLGARSGKRKMTLGNLYDPIGVKPSAVDVYARFFLPLSFILFQMIYWITCLAIKPPLPEGSIMIKHIEAI